MELPPSVKSLVEGKHILLELLRVKLWSIILAASLHSRLNCLYWSINFSTKEMQPSVITLDSNVQIQAPNTLIMNLSADLLQFFTFSFTFSFCFSVTSSVVDSIIFSTTTPTGPFDTTHCVNSSLVVSEVFSEETWNLEFDFTARHHLCQRLKILIWPKSWDKMSSNRHGWDTCQSR